MLHSVMLTKILFNLKRKAKIELYPTHLIQMQYVVTQPERIIFS